MQMQALPGFRDFYPAEYARLARLSGIWRQVARSYGFEEYDGPPLESLELYTAKSGDEIVGQLYTFEDKGGRAVALRPEMTPTLARMVSARANGLKKPIRWFSIPQLFRYERQQRGRLREHYQLNCDLIGEGGPLADAEIMALAIDVMRACGLTASDVRLRLSDRRLLSALLIDAGVDEVQLPAAYAAIDKAERADRGTLEKTLAAQGMAKAQISALFDVASLTGWSDVQSRTGPRAAPALAVMAEVLAAMDAFGLREFVEVDLTIVRGLAYYTGTVFELFDVQRAHRAICGGGRYDDLLKSLGGPDLPALGFGMGDVVLSDLLEERGLLEAVSMALDVFVVAVSAEDQPEVLRIAHQLRDHGLAVELALAESAVGRQMKLAASRGAAAVIVVGPEERAAGQVRWRALGTGDEGAGPLSEAVDLVQRLRNS